MQALAADGITVRSSRRQQEPRNPPGWNGGFYAFMRRVLATPAGAALYRRRSGHDRAGPRRHEVQPQDRPLLTPRQSRVPVGMAAHHRDHNLRKLHQHRLASAASHRGAHRSGNRPERIHDKRDPLARPVASRLCARATQEAPAPSYRDDQLFGVEVESLGDRGPRDLGADAAALENLDG
jgi:hypothetical protein